MVSIKNKSRSLLELIISAGFILVLTFLIVYKQAYIPKTDYNMHMQVTKHLYLILTEGTRSYPIWHLCVWAIYKIGSVIPITTECACAIATSLINLIIFLITYFIFKSNLVRHSALIAGALCLMGPIYIPWYNQNVYLGNGSPVTWHSPTNMAVKPFAIVSFYLLIGLIDSIEHYTKLNRRNYFIFMVITMISVLAKASYVQGIVIGLGIFIIVRLIITKFRTLKGYILLCLAFIPSGILILLQILTSASVNQTIPIGWGLSRKTAIGWGVSKAYTPNLYISLLLVLLFPLIYTLINIKKIYKETGVQLVWIYTISAWAQGCLLYFEGFEAYDDYGWASLIAYTIIWLYFGLRFFKEWQSNNLKGIKIFVLFGIWIVHLLCGCYYVFQLITIDGLWL